MAINEIGTLVGVTMPGEHQIDAVPLEKGHGVPPQANRAPLLVGVGRFPLE